MKFEVSLPSFVCRVVRVDGRKDPAVLHLHMEAHRKKFLP